MVFAPIRATIGLHLRSAPRGTCVCARFAAAACLSTQWEESDPRYITRSNEVKLRSFSTSVHKVDTLVAYKVDD